MGKLAVLALLALAVAAAAMPAEDLVGDPDVAIMSLVDDGTLDVAADDTVDLDLDEEDEAHEAQGEDCLTVVAHKQEGVCRLTSKCKKETVATFSCDNYLGRGEPYQVTYTLSPGKQIVNVQCDDCTPTDQIRERKPRVHNLKTAVPDGFKEEDKTMPLMTSSRSARSGSCAQRNGRCMSTAACKGGSWMTGKSCNGNYCCPGNDYCCAPATCETSQADAEKFLSEAAYRITTSSSGRCTDRYSRRCTSLTCIRSNAIRGIVALAQYCRTAIVITGGTEIGHSKSGQSHFEGYKLDLRLERVLDACIKKFKYIGKRRDGSALYESTSGNVYAKEGNHWDITFTHGGV